MASSSKQDPILEVPTGPDSGLDKMAVDHPPSPAYSEPGSSLFYDDDQAQHQPSPSPAFSGGSSMNQDAYNLCDPEEPMMQDPPPYDPKDPVMNTYELVKTRFELNNFKVDSPFCYARIPEDTGRLEQYDESKFRQYHRDKKYYHLDCETGKFQKNKFIDKWLDDENKRVVMKLVSDPEHKITDANVYNMWTGYAAEKLEPLEDPALAQEYAKPFIKHIHDVWTNGNMAHTNYCLAVFSQIIQHPGRKPGVAFYLYGSEGCGKGTIPEILRKRIMGTHCTYQTSNTEEDVFGRYAQALLNSRLTQVDEATSTHKNADKLKDKVTNDTHNYRGMHQNPIVMDNHATFIFTSNHENSLAISSTDRRFVLFHCSDVHRGDVEYFENLHAFYTVPKHERGLYEFLKTGTTYSPISRYQTERPATEFYREMQRANISIVSRYLSALVNSEFTGTLATHQMFAQCRELAEACNIPFHLNIIAFGRMIKPVLVCDRPRAQFQLQGRTHYNIVASELKDKLVATHSYDQDMAFP